MQQRIVDARTAIVGKLPALLDALDAAEDKRDALRTELVAVREERDQLLRVAEAAHILIDGWCWRGDRTPAQFIAADRGYREALAALHSSVTPGEET